MVSGKAESNHEVVPTQPQSSEGSKTYVMVCFFLKGYIFRICIKMIGYITKLFFMKWLGFIGDSVV